MSAPLRPQTLARLPWGLAALLCVLHVAHVRGDVDGAAVHWVASGWTTMAVFLLCAAACALRARCCPADRPAWLVLAGGLLLYSAGQACYLLITAHEAAPGFLTPSTVLWLTVYPCALGAMALLVRSRQVRLRPELWLDGAIGGLTVASLGVMVIFHVVIDPRDAVHAAATNVAFSLGDLLVVGAGVAGSALLGWRPPRALLALTAAFGVLGLQDTAFLGELVRGTFHPGTVLDSAWLIAITAVAGAAAWPRPQAPTPGVVEPRSVIAFPLLFALVAVGLTTWQSAASVQNLPIVLNALALTSVVARCGLTFRAHVAMIEAKERSEAHLAKAQRLAGLGSWEWEVVDERLTWSAEQARLHEWEGGAPPGTVEGFVTLIDERDRDAVWEAVAKVAAGDDELVVDYRVRTADGAARVIHTEGTVMRGGNGQPVALFGTSQDVTDPVRRAEAERANRAKSEFLSRMSHELRTPLNAVLGFAQLLAASDLTDRQRENVEQIAAAGRHQLSLVNEVLDVSRIETGTMSVSLEPVHVATVVEEAVALVAPMALDRDIAVRAEPGDGGLWAHADQQRLKQVLLNLLSNAVKYNRDHGRIGVRVERAGAGPVRIAVCDTGHGIAAEELSRLFTAFERLGAERGNVPGTGLGLALTRGLVDAMGGSIAVDSTPGEGTTFIVELAAGDPAGLLAPGFEGAVADVAAGPWRKVLCIEDNVANVRLIERIFDARPDLELLVAVQGSIGIELAQRHRPDVVLVDLNLPDIPGDDILARLHADPATAGTPVVILSADATPRQVQRLLAQGAHAYLTKPLDVGELLQVIDDVTVPATPQPA